MFAGTHGQFLYSHSLGWKIVDYLVQLYMLWYKNNITTTAQQFATRLPATGPPRTQPPDTPRAIYMLLLLLPLVERCDGGVVVVARGVVESYLEYDTHPVRPSSKPHHHHYHQLLRPPTQLCLGMFDIPGSGSWKTSCSCGGGRGDGGFRVCR